MQLKERIIIEVYTGFCMTSSEERNAVYEYMQKIMGRPIFTHELAEKSIQEELREKSKADFIGLCEPKPQTKADRIRSMCDGELAVFLCRVKADYQWVEHDFPSEDACGDWEEWLKKEVEDE